MEYFDDEDNEELFEDEVNTSIWGELSKEEIWMVITSLSSKDKEWIKQKINTE